MPTSYVDMDTSAADESNVRAGQCSAKNGAHALEAACPCGIISTNPSPGTCRVSSAFQAPTWSERPRPAANNGHVSDGGKTFFAVLASP